MCDTKYKIQNDKNTHCLYFYFYVSAVSLNGSSVHERASILNKKKPKKPIDELRKCLLSSSNWNKDSFQQSLRYDLLLWLIRT